MRDIAITLIVMIGCFYTLKKPYIGVLLWSWLSYMNPHKLAYGFAMHLPFAQATAIALIISFITSKQKQRIPINNVTIIWIIFILFMGVTTIFAYFPERSIEQFIKIIKIQLVVFLTIVFITDIEKLKHLIWVIVLSIGFYSIKGGVFTIATGGSYKVWGPTSSFIEGNNELAVAVLMVIPLMVFLRQITVNLWIKRGLLFAIVTSLFTVLGSQSRGALLAITAVAAFYWWKSKAKLVSGILILSLGLIMFSFMPESWFQRMDTIQTYEEDASAMGRINAWHYAFNAANNNLLGLGFESTSRETFALYAPNPKDVLVAHSIYFSVLGDHGWLGLLLFLLIFYLTWQKLTGVIKKASKNDELKEFELLARMMQVAFIAYFVGGAFLSLSYFDLPWHLVSFVVLIDEFMKNPSNKPGVTAISASSQEKLPLNKPNS